MIMKAVIWNYIRLLPQAAFIQRKAEKSYKVTKTLVSNSLLDEKMKNSMENIIPL